MILFINYRNSSLFKYCKAHLTNISNYFQGIYFYFYQNSIFLILGYKYLKYLIIGIHHPDIVFKSEILIEVVGTTEKYSKGITNEKYWEMI